MWLKELKKYVGILIVGIVLIAVYKTFDSLDWLFRAARTFWDLLSPFVIAAFLAYLLAIPCRKLETFLKKSKVAFFSTHALGISVASVYLIFMGLVALILLSILPSLIRSVVEFTEQLPSYIQGWVSWFNALGLFTIDQHTIQAFLSSDFFSLDKLLESFSLDNMNRYAQGVVSVGSSLFNLFLGVIVSVYLLLDRHNLKRNFSRLAHSFIPEKTWGILSRYGKKINEFVTLYISCQLVDAIIVFVLSFVALSVMQVKYAPLLALMVGSFNLIPYFGAIIATVIAGLVTIFTSSFTYGLIVVVVLIVIGQLDANFIQPKLISGSLNIKPFWVIMGIVLGGALFGVIGILLAAPVFALLRIIVLDILEMRENKKLSLPEELQS